MINNDFYKIKESKTFGISAENPTGQKSGGTAKECDKPSPRKIVGPGETVTIADIKGPGVINHIWMGGKIDQTMVLRIYWDYQEHPSVESPLSAFFGWAYCQNFEDVNGKYPFLNSAVIMTAPAVGCNSYFPMPFLKHCKITIENRSNQEKETYYMITGSHEDVEDPCAYFHASYRQEHPVTKGHTYTVIDGIKGKGQFVGITLAAGINGNSTCWVEGEARMYIDGEATPSLQYTGTEDYFCGSYAFGNDNVLHHYEPYSGLYSGMFCVMGDTSSRYNTQQRFLLYRFHIADPIRFNTEFRMTLDNLGWTGPRYDDYTTVAYWYQTLPSAPLKSLPEPKEMDMR